MVKKSLIAGAALLLLTVLMFGRDAVSVVKTFARQTQDTVANQIPVEFDIDRAREAMKGLEPEIRRNVHLIAKEEVEIEKLEKTIAKSETQLAQDRRNTGQNLLAYFSPEVTLRLKQLPGAELAVRIHHRSGGRDFILGPLFGSDQGGGAQYLTAGVRWRF